MDLQLDNGYAFINLSITEALEELGGRARSVHIVDCCVHTSTAGLGGQIFWFWTSFNVCGAVGFETFVI